MAASVISAVCSEPKVFVGQLPVEAQQQDLIRVFSQYGTIKSAVVISSGSHPGPRCAMVLYEKWSHAEAAVENEQGKSSLGGIKPLVVKLADPPKRAGSVGPGAAVGIAPKKLFVGQVPTAVSDDELKNLFSPYGEVVDLHRLDKPGQPIGCAFVTFSRWAEAEAAIDALNGQHQYPEAKAKLVVKFADARMDASIRPGEKRPLGTDMAQGPSKKAFTGGPLAMAYGRGGMASLAGYPLGMGRLGMNPMLAMGMPNFSALNLNGLGIANMQALSMMNPAAAAALGSAAAAAANIAHGGKGSGPGAPWKLFVGQIPYEMTEADLYSVFGSMGGLAEVAVLRGHDGRSKGCAFVTYLAQQQAEQAVQQLNGKALPGDPRGKAIVVKYANQR